MAAALKPDITIIRGDDTTITFEMTVNNAPINLSTYEVFFTAKPALTNDTGDSSAVIKVAVNGTGVIPLSHSDTDVAPGDYYYDIQVKDGSGNITSIQPRLLQVVADVTRRTAP